MSFSILCYPVLLASGLEKPVNYNARLVEVLEGYRELLSIEPDRDVDDIAAVDWKVVEWSIGEGYIRFTVDPGAKGLLNGARFDVPQKDKAVTYIIVSEDLLDLWGNWPSTVYAMLAKVSHEASVFFQGPDKWAKIVQDDMEYLLMRMDAFVAQAELIKNRLLPEGYLLSSYDTYLLDSYDQDGMSSVCLFLEKFSLPIVKELYNARVAYEKDDDAQKLRSLIMTLGEKLLHSRNELPNDSEDLKIYPLAIAVHTWLEFTPELIARTYNKSRPDKPLTFAKILNREKDYDTLRQKLETTRTRDVPLMERIIKEYPGQIYGKGRLKKFFRTPRSLLLIVFH